MVSFADLWVRICNESSQQDTKAMEAIRGGLNVRDDFWDDFLKAIGNADAMSELLDIPAVKISGWHSKVSKALEAVKTADAGPESKKNRRLLPTGEDDGMNDPMDNNIAAPEIS